jgi:PAS domain S-box-containing protein
MFRYPLLEVAVETPLPTHHQFILDSIAEGVFTVDADWNITSFNHAAEMIVGVARDQALGKKCFDLFQANICHRACAVKKTLETGEAQVGVRVDIRNFSGELVPVRVSTSLLKNRRGDLLGAVEVLTDLREVVEMHREFTSESNGASNHFDELIGCSPAMKRLFKLIPDVAETEATVLIEGASGTGKELVARALHRHSPRKDKPFVVLNCGALPDTLLEAELFGHRRGAFTDAKTTREGLLAQAEGGTLFLDEISDTSVPFQVKLLRVLEEGEYRSLGSSDVKRVDVRVISACNRSLMSMMQAGEFREDLYYRLRVIPILISPLRKRRQDIPLLIEHFMRVQAQRTGKMIIDVSPAALASLYDYDYPGNVRELKNVVERAFVLCHGSRIERRHLPEEMWPREGDSSGSSAANEEDERERLRPSEKTILEANVKMTNARRENPEIRKLIAVLDAYNWNRTRTAKALGIGRNTLWRRMREYGLLDRH